MSDFKLFADFSPRGDQPKAIKRLTKGLLDGAREQTLLGVTGSGKTFTIANVIEKVNKPVLVMSHNKTLAAQLYSEFRDFFPENAVEYFVSYYDYYQPEAYIPRTDTYIEKDAKINEDIDRLRHSATQAVLERRDVIIVASISCIYGLGSPEDYSDTLIHLAKGQRMDRDRLLEKLLKMQFERNDFDLRRGSFRVRGDIIELQPANREDLLIRLEFFGDELELIEFASPVTGDRLEEREDLTLFPAKHFITPGPKLDRAVEKIKEELKERVNWFQKEGKYLEAQRISERTKYDLEMLRQLGYCAGVENYSRHLSGREEGEPPDTLIDYFPEDFLVIIDESHVTLPQLKGMCRGDRSRKNNLIDHGFRLPSAYDNRPLTFEEFMEKVPQIIYVSATPGPYEMEQSSSVVEQIIRPTGLVDPKLIVRPLHHQVDDLIDEIKIRVEREERVLVTTLTKKMAEDLTEYLREIGVKVRYIHCDVDTLDRVELIRDLRLGNFHVLVGINLLREGLDLPEVSLVAILDADKEGFLRSETSLIQTIGRAARNVSGEVIMYGDKTTGSMQRAISETERRRIIQTGYNEEYGIIPETIRKSVRDVLLLRVGESSGKYRTEEREEHFTEEEIKDLIGQLEISMKEAAENWEFEKAILFRDEIGKLKKKLLK